MHKVVNAFLWRQCNKATVDSLLGESRGQYDIRLGSGKYDAFFQGAQSQNQTQLGGYDYIINIHPFTGKNEVEAHSLTVRFMGPNSSRKDWYIRSQRPESAYELWRMGRGFSARSDVGDKDFIVIARDTDNDFHARWIRSADFDHLPDRMKEAMEKRDSGWQEL